MLNFSVVFNKTLHNELRVLPENSQTKKVDNRRELIV